VPGQANRRSVQAAVDTLMAVAARKGISVSLSVRGVEEVQDALKKRARLASVGILETGLSSFEGMATECDQMIAEEGA
jgi:hypothetical protein